MGHGGLSWVRAVGIATAVTVIAGAAVWGGEARARSSALRLRSVSVQDRSDVALNEPIEFRFSRTLRPGTVDEVSIEIRGEDAPGSASTRQVPGRFEVRGRFVVFTPLLPTHLVDPADPEGGFFEVGSVRDDAAANAGLQPSTKYQIRVLARPRRNAVRSRRGKRLRRTRVFRFTTAAEEPASPAFTDAVYVDLPPPRVRFTNPPQVVASAADRYTRSGGVADVPRGAALTVFLNRVPLSVTNLREPGVVTLEMLEEGGDPSARRLIEGDVFVDQRPDDVRLVFRPRFTLPAQSVFALRVSEEVTDLTRQFPLQNSEERNRLADMHQFLVTARLMHPGTPDELLPSPAPDLAFDWPSENSERELLKRNLLALGDTRPEAVDRRVVLLFTTAE